MGHFFPLIKDYQMQKCMPRCSAPEVLGLAAAAAIESARAGPREPGAAAGAEVRAAFGPGGAEHVLVVRWPAAAPGDGPPWPGPCTVEAVFAPGDCPEVLAGEPE